MAGLLVRSDARQATHRIHELLKRNQPTRDLGASSHKMVITTTSRRHGSILSEPQTQRSEIKSRRTLPQNVGSLDAYVIAPHHLTVSNTVVGRAGYVDAGHALLRALPPAAAGSSASSKLQLISNTDNKAETQGVSCH